MKKFLIILAVMIIACGFITLYLYYPQEVTIYLRETIPYDSRTTDIPVDISTWWAQVGENGENNIFDLNYVGLQSKLNEIKARANKEFGKEGSIIISWGYPLDRLWYRRIHISCRGISILDSSGYVTDALFKKQPRRDCIYVYYLKSKLKLIDRYGADLEAEVKFAE